MGPLRELFITLDLYSSSGLMAYICVVDVPASFLLVKSVIQNGRWNFEVVQRLFCPDSVTWVLTMEFLFPSNGCFWVGSYKF